MNKLHAYEEKIAYSLKHKKVTRQTINIAINLLGVNEQAYLAARQPRAHGLPEPFHGYVNNMLKMDALEFNAILRM